MPPFQANKGGRPKNKRKKQQALLVISENLFDHLQTLLEAQGVVVYSEGQVIEFVKSICYDALKQVAYNDNKSDNEIKIY